jgi:hypothetical protein
MIPDPGESLDDGGYPWQRPQVAAETMRRSALSERVLDTPQLASIQ